MNKWQLKHNVNITSFNMGHLNEIQLSVYRIFRKGPYWLRYGHKTNVLFFTCIFLHKAQIQILKYTINPGELLCSITCEKLAMY